MTLMRMMIMSFMSGVMAIKNTKNRRKRQADLDTVELCIVTMNYKHWTHAKEVFKPLRYNQKTVDIAKAFCYLENYTQNYQRNGFPTARYHVNWAQDLQKHNTFINEEGMHKFVFQSTANSKGLHKTLLQCQILDQTQQIRSSCLPLTICKK